MRAKLPSKEGFVERDGVKIHYEVYGNGPETMMFLPPGSAKSTYATVVAPTHAMGARPGMSSRWRFSPRRCAGRAWLC